ncbi:GDSL-type esterase/lipase family protein [Gemmatimonas sp.]|jgi:hypothetical protein|uniref:GDSL-type esterase/lipase family protein n=1 Tax=Gemmatimonas sp. TaxID=1962908 RepID=UPI0037C09840
MRPTVKATAIPHRPFGPKTLLTPIFALVVTSFSTLQAQTAGLPVATAPADSVLPAYVPKGSKIGFADAIAAFETNDRLAPPPAAGILFIGSSIFRQWEALTEQMAPLPVYNRAFGGSKTWEVLHYTDRVVLPYKPRFVVYYCGSNDVKGKHAAAGIIDRIRQFNTKVHTALPGTTIFFTAIQRAPDKRARWAVVDSVNAVLRDDAARSGGWLRYVDLNPVLFDARGEIRGALFKPDSLHFKPDAYVEFTAVLKPVLEEAWRSARR